MEGKCVRVNDQTQGGPIIAARSSRTSTGSKASPLLAGTDRVHPYQTGGGQSTKPKPDRGQSTSQQPDWKPDRGQSTSQQTGNRIGDRARTRETGSEPDRGQSTRRRSNVSRRVRDSPPNAIFQLRASHAWCSVPVFGSETNGRAVGPLVFVLGPVPSPLGCRLYTFRQEIIKKHTSFGMKFAPS